VLDDDPRDDDREPRNAVSGRALEASDLFAAFAGCPTRGPRRDAPGARNLRHGQQRDAPNRPSNMHIGDRGA
jgi:hypothetical protein